MVLASFLSAWGTSRGIVQQRGSPDDLKIRAFYRGQFFRHAVNTDDMVIAMHGVKTGIPGSGIFKCGQFGSLMRSGVILSQLGKGLDHFPAYRARNSGMGTHSSVRFTSKRLFPLVLPGLKAQISQ